MIIRLLRNHFWRCYARELMRSPVPKFEAAVEEAAYKAAWVAVPCVIGVSVSVLALADWYLPKLRNFFLTHEGVVLVTFGALSLATYITVRRFLLRRCRIEPREVLEKYGHRRDRILILVQFWVGLLISLSAPVLIFAVLGRT